MIKTIDTKTIIINLMRKNKKRYLSINELQKFMDYLYEKIKESGEKVNYWISYNINKASICRTVELNSSIFGLDIDEENIYLKEDNPFEIKCMRCYSVDDTISNIINSFSYCN